MFCIRCRHDVIDCTCPDIEDRLRSLSGPESLAAPAAILNRQARALKRLTEDQQPS